MYKQKGTAAHEEGNILKLVFYLLMVHKEDNFPRLTCNSPQLRASCHTQPHPVTTLVGRSTMPSDGEGGELESELNAKVRAHRRKLGFGSLSAGSSASHVVLERSIINEQIRGVQTHLETTIKNALYHMRRDELWKRLLYGKEKNSQDSNKPVHVSSLFLSFSHSRLDSFSLPPLSPTQTTLSPSLSPLSSLSPSFPPSLALCLPHSHSLPSPLPHLTLSYYLLTHSLPINIPLIIR